MQREAIIRAASARGETIGRWFAETRGGASRARPELDRLIECARRGQFRSVWVYKLDRLTRAGVRDTLDVVSTLADYGCPLRTVADGFDFNGPAGTIVLAVMGWAADVERLAINERIAAARERKEAKGERWGRPPRLTADESRRARQLRQQGRSIRQISMALKVPRSTVHRTLRLARTSRRR